MTLDQCVLSFNHAEGDGGAVFNQGYLTACSCDVLNNEADIHGGGIANSFGMLVVSACNIQGNTAHQVGGGIYTAQEGNTCEIGDSTTIIDNIAYSLGGGIYVQGPELFTMTGGTIHYNRVTQTNGKGGGIYFHGVGATAVTLTGVSITNNTATVAGGKGGGWYIDANSNPTFDTCTLSDNFATTLGDGGAFATGGNYNPINCTFTDVISEDT